ncbi:MAG: hypothetical protein ACR2HV_05745 [Acidimicrobiales bacterium]
MGVLVAACGDEDTVAAPEPPDSSIDGPTTSGPDPGPGPGQDPGPGPDPGPPLDVPPIGGNDIESVKEDAEEQFKKVCGGTVCVNLVVVVPPEPPGEDCDVSFIGTSPAEGSQVQRGSTVKLLFELDSCFVTETTVPEPGSSTTTTID